MDHLFDRLLFELSFYRFESLHRRNVQKGNSGEVEDQAVEVHSGEVDPGRKIGVHVYLKRDVLRITRRVHLLGVCIHFIGSRPAGILQGFLLRKKVKFKTVQL